MAQQRETGGRAAADLVLRLSRAALGEGFVEALTSAQWMALRYFSRANRFSRTVLRSPSSTRPRAGPHRRP